MSDDWLCINSLPNRISADKKHAFLKESDNVHGMGKMNPHNALKVVVGEITCIEWTHGYDFFCAEIEKKLSIAQRRDFKNEHRCQSEQ